MEEARRILNLKKKLIKELPFFPNNKATLIELESKSLNEVLIHYLHWKTRLVPSRVRKVHIAPEVTSDKRWPALRSNINSLLDKIRLGEDVLPYLSKRAHSYGYTPVKRIKDGQVDLWVDKDHILNTKGFHHFHLNMNVQHTGLSDRTDEVLLAHVTREEFHGIGIFNHSVFDSADKNGEMNTERSRMWELYEKHTSFGLEPGAVYISNPITASGHPLQIIQMSDYYSELIRENDPKLDEREFVNNLFDQGKIAYPDKYSFEWVINDLDLCVYEKRTRILFNFHLGHI